MKLPARCNKRHCQARRNLSKWPEEYKYWPKCHVCDEGKMYVDKYRLRKGEKDNAPVCQSAYCAVYTPSGKHLPFHRVNTKGCIHYEDHIHKRNTSPRSKHSPIDEEDWCPF